MKVMLGTTAPEEEQGKRAIHYLLAIKNSLNLQPNTGYNLMIFGRFGYHDAKMTLTNPHILPVELQTSSDGIQNSRKALNEALYEISENISKFSPSLFNLKNMLADLKA
jgi:hypothetical protein